MVKKLCLTTFFISLVFLGNVSFAQTDIDLRFNEAILLDFENASWSGISKSCLNEIVEQVDHRLPEVDAHALYISKNSKYLVLALVDKNVVTNINKQFLFKLDAAKVKNAKNGLKTVEQICSDDFFENSPPLTLPTEHHLKRERCFRDFPGKPSNCVNREIWYSKTLNFDPSVKEIANTFPHYSTLDTSGFDADCMVQVVEAMSKGKNNEIRDADDLDIKLSLSHSTPRFLVAQVQYSYYPFTSLIPDIKTTTELRFVYHLGSEHITQDKLYMENKQCLNLNFFDKQDTRLIEYIKR